MCVDNGSQKMGFPIQKFPDQSLFAAPRDLSQRTTSFIASQRQGIHRIPLRHLIVLEIRKRTTRVQKSPSGAHAIVFDLKFRKDQFCFKHIRDPAVRRGSRLVCSQFRKSGGKRPRFLLSPSPIRPPPFLLRDRMCFLFTMSILVGVSVRKNPSGHPSLKAAKTGSFEDRNLRRAMRPDEDLAIFKLILIGSAVS
jgi:hypothetical protein